ncbi:hypothetical protein MRX96_052645 [Rhipicephalus microplus]
MPLSNLAQALRRLQHPLLSRSPRSGAVSLHHPETYAAQLSLDRAVWVFPRSSNHGSFPTAARNPTGRQHARGLYDPGTIPRSSSVYGNEPGPGF